MKIRLQDLPDINTWTSQRSVAYIERTVAQVNECVHSVLNDLTKMGASHDDLQQTSMDILNLLDTMPIYFYDPDKKCLSAIGFPKESLMMNMILPSRLDDAVPFGEPETTQLLSELNDDFVTYHMMEITRQKMRLIDALYIIHRGNIETMLWFALLNRLRRNGIVEFNEKQDPATSIMCGCIAQSIQSIVQFNFVIRNHGVPGHDGQHVLMGLNQSIGMDHPSHLESTLFAAMNRPLASPNILIPCLEVKSVAYHFIPKDTLK